MAIKQETINNGMIWSGLLLAPAAWLIQFETNYVLVEWACSHGQNLTPLYAVSIFFLLSSIGSAFLSWHNWNLAESPNLRFLTMVGVLMSALFSLAIIAQMIPIFILSPCIR